MTVMHTDWQGIVEQAESLVSGEPDLIANSANLVALLFHAMPDVNWVGVYLMRDGELVVGPFQGKPACVRIPVGRGVCGTAAARVETVVVEDVHAFDGHIACDTASNSEIVVPLIGTDGLIGVLDVDSPEFARFNADDREGLEAIGRILVRAST